MSMFFVPDGLMPDARTMEANLKKISQDMDVLMPKGFGGDGSAANLYAAPAAFMALGAGMAGHAFGMWLSAVSSSLHLAEKMSTGIYPVDDGDDDKPAYKAPISPAKRARAALDTVAADAVAAAEEALEAGVKAAAGIGDAADATASPEPAVPQDAAAAQSDAAPLARAKPVGIERPEAIDNLKAISGVGPKLEKVLNGLGIWTYGQINALGAAEIAWLDEHLGFRGRIGRDDWVGQAARLAGKA